jgi:hypothetical protein
MNYSILIVFVTRPPQASAPQLAGLRPENCDKTGV